jgi:DNA polymerase-3 subunit alpha/error-prone DNA polymerase
MIKIFTDWSFWKPHSANLFGVSYVGEWENSHHLDVLYASVINSQGESYMVFAYPRGMSGKTGVTVIGPDGKESNAGYTAAV